MSADSLSAEGAGRRATEDEIRTLSAGRALVGLEMTGQGTGTGVFGLDLERWSCARWL
jgi:hypothetical protein